jgi:predicted esterase
MTHRFAAVLAAATALLGCARAATAQEPLGDTIPRGRVVERVRSGTDTSRTYALYVPSAWTPQKKWPLLVLIDPGGRALAPMERFRAAAEERGWILMSGWQVGNGDAEAMARNDVSIDAILADAQQRLSIDPRRIYFAGFSGMARYSWLVARVLGPNVAGIIGAGAGFPQQNAIWLATLGGVRPFPFFATIGSTDFNQAEVTTVDSLLDATPFPHHLARFEGGHQWPPDSVAAQALDWMQLQAMRAGTAPADSAFTDALFRAGMARAAAMVQRNHRLQALREYGSLLADFQGLHDLAPARGALDALNRDPAMGRERSRAQALERQYRRYQTAIFGVVDALNTGDAAAAERRAAESLQVAAVRRQEQDSTADRDASQTATRMLNTALVAMDDAAGEFSRDQRWMAAAAALRIARTIRPENAYVCYPLARALAQLGDKPGAMAALTCAVDGKAVRRATVEADHLLDPLRDDPRFAELAARATAS